VAVSERNPWLASTAARSPGLRTWPLNKLCPLINCIFQDWLCCTAPLSARGQVIAGVVSKAGL
jgi:hypothetical protein